MKDTFYLPKIETRSKLVEGVKKYIIKGYAATGNTYVHKTENGRSFKEFFTEEAIESIKRKAKSEPIRVDFGHAWANEKNIKATLEAIETRSGLNLTEEKQYVLDRMSHEEIPMFKVEDIQIDDKGLFIEIQANPFFREADEQHQKYFDVIWNSLENGFINGMSLNFNPTDIVHINDQLDQINDVDIYGVSLVSGGANEMATITEVATRCVEHTRGEAICPTRLKLLR